MPIPSRLMLFCFLLLLIWPQPLLAEDELLQIDSLSTTVISFTEKKPYTTTIAIYGEKLDYLLHDDLTVGLGPFQTTTISGNAQGMNLTFVLNVANLPAEKYSSYPLVIKQSNVVIYSSVNTITFINPYVGKHVSAKIKHFFNKHVHHPHKPNKQMVGLNMHWALGGSTAEDAAFQKKISGSRAVWAREHFDFVALTGENQTGWLKRYDQIMLYYQQNNIKVIGMLAYGDGTDKYTPPQQQRWQQFVRTVAQRYHNDVVVWEIWNEPDSTTYLHPNTWASYRPLLKKAAKTIRTYDPDAIILNGAIANITNLDYINTLYKKGHKYFDELNVHIYYCDQYLQAGKKLTNLQADWEQLLQTTKQYRPTEHIWITELGCSNGYNHVSDQTVRTYLKRATSLLLRYPSARPIFLYSFRDRSYLEPYEANFGLLHEDVTAKMAWRWYRKMHSK